MKATEQHVVYCYQSKGSVPLRPGENIRKFESQNVVHCLVSMCPSMY